MSRFLTGIVCQKLGYLKKKKNNYFSVSTCGQSFRRLRPRKRTVSRTWGTCENNLVYIYIYIYGISKGCRCSLKDCDRDNCGIKNTANVVDIA